MIEHWDKLLAVAVVAASFVLLGMGVRNQRKTTSECLLRNREAALSEAVVVCLRAQSNLIAESSLVPPGLEQEKAIARVSGAEVCVLALQLLERRKAIARKKRKKRRYLHGAKLTRKEL